MRAELRVCQNGRKRQQETTHKNKLPIKIHNLYLKKMLILTLQNRYCFFANPIIFPQVSNSKNII